MSTQELVDTPPAANARSQGMVGFIDQNHYFSLEYPPAWEVAEIKDTVGLTIAAPPVEGQWRARVKVNVRTCPRGRTLEQTLLLFRNDMMRIPGVTFSGQSSGVHVCGKPAGRLRWLMLRDQATLRVEQVFIAFSASILLQLTASATSEAFEDYARSFREIIETIRPLPALLTRALLLPGRNNAQGDAVPAPAARPESPIAGTAPADASAETLPLPLPDAPAPTPALAPAEPSRPAAVEIASATPPIAVDDLALPVLEVEPDAAAESTPEIVATAPLEVVLTPAPLAARAPESEPAPVAAMGVAIEAPPTAENTDTPAQQAGEDAPRVEDTGASAADSTEAPTPAALVAAAIAPAVGAPALPAAAYARLWAFLDLTAKNFVAEVRRASRRNGVKAGHKALFEGRAYLYDVLCRAMAVTPDGRNGHGRELATYLRKKIASRSQKIHNEFTQRASAYARAGTAAETGEPGATSAVEILADFLGGDADQRQHLLAALAEVETGVVQPFRERIEGLFTRQPSTWWQLGPEAVDAQLQQA